MRPGEVRKYCQLDETGSALVGATATGMDADYEAIHGATPAAMAAAALGSSPVHSR